MNTLKVDVSLPTDVAEACVAAVGPETKSEALTRSKLTLKKTADGLRLSIEAEDLHAMRAAANTYLRWIIMCTELARDK